MPPRKLQATRPVLLGSDIHIFCLVSFLFSFYLIHPFLVQCLKQRLYKTANKAPKAIDASIMLIRPIKNVPNPKGCALYIFVKSMPWNQGPKNLTVPAGHSLTAA